MNEYYSQYLENDISWDRKKDILKQYSFQLFFKNLSVVSMSSLSWKDYKFDLKTSLFCK